MTCHLHDLDFIICYLWISTFERGRIALQGVLDTANIALVYDYTIQSLNHVVMDYYILSTWLTKG